MATERIYFFRFPFNNHPNCLIMDRVVPYINRIIPEAKQKIRLNIWERPPGWKIHREVR